MEIAEALKRFRTEFNVTQRQAAIAVGVTDRAYGDYERGTARIPGTAVVKLADTFGVSADYLLGRTDVPNPAAPAVSEADVEAIKQELLAEFDRRIAKRVQRAAALLYAPDLDKLLEKTGEGTPS